MPAGDPKEPKVFVGTTPEGQLVAETPRVAAPQIQSAYWGEWGYWLGDPDRRYGVLTSSRSIPIKTKMEMLRDPVIAIGQGFIGAALVKATRVIECVDEEKRRFFEAMFRSWEQEFILQAALAVSLGSVGLIKNFAFHVPEQVEIDEDPVWTAKATPFIITGFDAVYPVGSYPKFDDKRRHFQGIHAHDGQEIDTFFSMWVTLNQARAFGDYLGSGRLENAYQDWWMKHFGRDLYLIFLQKHITPSVKVGYPSGTSRDGKSYRDVAIETGAALRSGTTVAVPSSVYQTTEGMSGDERLSAIRKWTIDFMEPVGAVQAFHEIDDHHDRKILLGLLIPYQAVMEVTGGDLGGPTSADKLTELAEDLLMLDAADIDRHLNDYALPAVERANFPPGSPRVRVKTVGLEPDTRNDLREVIKTVASRADVDVSYFDFSEALRRLHLPVAEGGTTIIEPPTIEPIVPEIVPAALQGDDGVPVEGIENPPPDVLQRMVEDVLPQLPTPGEEIISEEDIQRAVHKLHDAFPEAFAPEESH